MKSCIKTLPFALAFTAQTNARSFHRFTLVRAHRAPLSVAPSSRIAEPSLLSIYAVDDAPCLTELYSNLLDARGYMVITFNDRAKALVALKAARRKPALLITDYMGLSMPINEFMQACRSIHPALRILMASGLSRNDMRFSQVAPDRFIQKPFAAEEFQQAVRDALAVK